MPIIGGFTWIYVDRSQGSDLGKPIQYRVSERSSYSRIFYASDHASGHKAELLLGTIMPRGTHGGWSWAWLPTINNYVLTITGWVTPPLASTF